MSRTYVKIVMIIIGIAISAMAVPRLINYQGKITNVDGVAIDSTCQITLAIYNIEFGGGPLWSEVHASVDVNKGLFDVILGETTSFPDTLDFSEQYWLQIIVGTEPLSPRQPLSTLPYTFRAAIADSVVGGGGGGATDTDWEWSSGSGLTGDIYHTGNVGIGTTTPAEKLDVNGNLYLSGGDLRTDRWTEGVSSTYIGMSVAGRCNVTGGYNTYLGYQSGYGWFGAGGGDASGFFNTFIGATAGAWCESGSRNTFVGRQCGFFNQFGNQNTFVGCDAGQANWDGDFNTIVGGYAGYSTQNSDNNSFFGAHSGYNTTGYNNIFVGFKAGYSVTTGHDNIFIGHEVDAPDPATNNHLNIGNVIYGDLSSGNVGIGETSPDERLVVDNSITVGKYTTSGWTHSSDIRLKNNIKPLESSLEKILQLQGVRFDYKNEDSNNSSHIGFIAQDMEKLFPEIVVTGADGYKSIAYGQLEPALVEAIKQLKAENDRQNAEIERLKALEARIEQLEKAK